MTTILFRTEAGPHCGLGHLQRCLSLAKALHRLGAACIFLINGHPAALRRVTASGFKSDSLKSIRPGSQGDLDHTLVAAHRRRCDIVVVDSYSVSGGYLRALRAGGLFVAAIDDLARFAFPCQLVVNLGAHASRLHYRSCSKDTRFLLGPSYALLRPEFWKVPPRKTQRVVRNVLVILGGADRRNLMPELLRMLQECSGAFSVKAVIGPFFKNRSAVRRLAEKSRRSVNLAENPSSIRDLMCEADVAISGAGQTLYELACVGCPAVALKIASNQGMQLKAFAEAGTVLDVREARQRNAVRRIREALLSLLNDRTARMAMAQAGQRLVDGQGALRVARVLLEK